MGVEERAEKSSAKAAGSHKIIHIDMDALYASVEQHDNPEPRLLGGTEGSQTLPWREPDSNFRFRARMATASSLRTLSISLKLLVFYRRGSLREGPKVRTVGSFLYDHRSVARRSRLPS